MIGCRILRVNAVILLFTLLLVPALTQPSRLLSSGPVNQSSSFSRLGVLSTDRLPMAAAHAAAIDVVAALADFALAPAIAAAMPVVRSVPLPLATFLPPLPLRAPPAALVA